MAGTFALRSYRSDCCAVLELSGELDMATAPEFEAALDRMMVIPDHLRVDVSELSFIDSTGLRLLLRASTLVGGRMWIKGPSPHLVRVIDISGLSASFCLEQDPELAHRLISAA